MHVTGEPTIGVYLGEKCKRKLFIEENFVSTSFCTVILKGRQGETVDNNNFNDIIVIISCVYKWIGQISQYRLCACVLSLGKFLSQWGCN